MTEQETYKHPYQSTIDEYNKNDCAICGNQPSMYLNAYSTIRVCEKHKEFDKVWQVEIVQKELGIISEYKDEFKKCEICEKQLNEQEVGSLDKYDSHRTCTEHRDVRKWLQKDISILWFEYIKINPNADHENLTDLHSFTEWRNQKTK